jgi:hypothetical protein
MDTNTLAIRKNAMKSRKDWNFRGLNSTARDRAGSKVSAAWNHVVGATDGGTKEQISAAIAAAKRAEQDFRNDWD